MGVLAFVFAYPLARLTIAPSGKATDIAALGNYSFERSDSKGHIMFGHPLSGGN